MFYLCNDNYRRVMAKIKNPFIVLGKINPAYFCDRVKESEILVKSLTNGNNLVLISPRRMGKTGLISYCYDKPQLSKGYYTFFIDILHTTSLREFTYLFGRHIYETLLPRSKKMVVSFIHALKSLSGKFGFDPFSSLPTFSLEITDITKPELTLEEIFQYLENAPRPCIVAFDEFQQIASYPEKNVEALLRTFIQRMNNVNFIFAGSEYHIMQEMFLSSAKPFYNSADILELKAIDPNVYSMFVKKHMKSGGITIGEEVINMVYNLMEGNTYAMQKTFNEAFSLLSSGEECSLEYVTQAIKNVIESKEPLYKELLSNISERYKPLLYSIAQDRKVKQITSVKFIHQHHLSSASSVQYSAKLLLEKGLITRVNGVYSVTDVFFALWINNLYGKKKLVTLLNESSSIN